MRRPLACLLLVLGCSNDPAPIDSGTDAGLDVPALDGGDAAVTADSAPAPDRAGDAVADTPVPDAADAQLAPDAPPRVCTPGAQIACACVGGSAGAQVCNAEGTALGPCACPDAGSPVDASSDVATDNGFDPRCDAATASYCANDAGSGVCVDLQTDPLNCGGCGRRCPDPPVGGIAICSRGVCTIGLSCPSGRRDCDSNVANGCETDTAADALNCGACGNACVGGAGSPASCVSGRCALTCVTGYADCDLDPSNGCEVDTRTSSAHCGACGRACAPRSHAEVACGAGACALACAMAYANCDGDAANGCETTTLNSVMNCGIGGPANNGCGVVCPQAGGTPACNGGVCSITCNTGLGDCDTNRGNGCETNTTNNVNHCGRCGNRCADGQGCVGGACR